MRTRCARDRTRGRRGGTGPGDDGGPGGDDGEDADDGGSYLLHVFGSRPLMNVDVSRDLGGSSIFVDVAVATIASSSSSSSSPSRGFDGHRVNDGATVLSNDEGGALEY